MPSSSRSQSGGQSSTTTATLRNAPRNRSGSPSRARRSSSSKARRLMALFLPPDRHPRLHPRQHLGGKLGGARVSFLGERFDERDGHLLVVGEDDPHLLAHLHEGGDE